jgi:hypothetical protein
LAGGERACEGVACACFADDGEDGPGCGPAIDGVAIHGGGGEWGLVAIRYRGAGHDAAIGTPERDDFGGQRGDKAEYKLKCLFNRDHDVAS